jgi:murein L,D-transpeptidase YcbB/YkuD
MAPEVLPVPDPSRLTTEQLHREMEMLKELMETKIDCLAASHNEFKETFKTLHADLNKEMETKLRSLKEIHDASIGSLKELHNAAIHDTQQNATMLTQVLQTAVNKSEDSYRGQFEAIRTNYETQNKANADRLEDLKGRMDRQSGHSDVWGWIAAAVAALVAILEYKK